MDKNNCYLFPEWFDLKQCIDLSISTIEIFSKSVKGKIWALRLFINTLKGVCSPFHLG